MRPGTAAAVFVLLVAPSGSGCRRRAPESPTPEAHPSPRGAELSPRRPVRGPLFWTEPRGLCLDVPEGWSGFDVGDDGVLISLEHRATGTRFEAREAGPREALEGHVRIFEDEAAYRAVPVLFPAATTTWISSGPNGTTLQEWSGRVGDRPIRVEVTYPPGGVIAGRAAADPLLEGLCHARSR